MAPSGSGWRRLRVWMRNVDRKEAKSAAWISEESAMLGSSGCLIWPYEDEDDIEQILPFALALVVFNGSGAEVVFPGRFGLVPWIWKWSDWFAVGQADCTCSAALRLLERMSWQLTGFNIILTKYIILRTSPSSRRR